MGVCVEDLAIVYDLRRGLFTLFLRLYDSRFVFFAILTFLFLRALTDKSISNRGENASLLGPENRFCFFPWKTSSDASLWSCNMHLLLLSITFSKGWQSDIIPLHGGVPVGGAGKGLRLTFLFYP